MATKFGKNASAGARDASKGEPPIERFQPDTMNGLVIPEISVTQTGANHGMSSKAGNSDSGSFYEVTLPKKRKGTMPQGNH